MDTQRVEVMSWQPYVFLRFTLHFLKWFATNIGLLFYFSKFR